MVWNSYFIAGIGRDFIEVSWVVFWHISLVFFYSDPITVFRRLVIIIAFITNLLRLIVKTLLPWVDPLIELFCYISQSESPGISGVGDVVGCTSHQQVHHQIGDGGGGDCC